MMVRPKASAFKGEETGEYDDAYDNMGNGGVGLAGGKRGLDLR